MSSRDSGQENFGVHQNSITEQVRKFFIQATTLVLEAHETSSLRRTGGEDSVRIANNWSEHCLVFGTVKQICELRPARTWR